MEQEDVDESTAAELQNELATVLGLSTEPNWRPYLGVRNDACIQLQIAPDEMSAIVCSYQPAGPGGIELNIPIIMLNLLQQGVVHGLCREGMIEIFRRVKNGTSPIGIELARGTPPSPAKDACLEALGNFNFPVFPGDAILALAPWVPYKSGKTVRGRAVDNPNFRRTCNKTLSYELQFGCVRNEERNVIESERYGLVKLTGNLVSVVPLYRISPDNMTIRLLVYSKDFLGEAITEDRLRRALLPLQTGLPLHPQALQDAIAAAASSERPILSDPVVTGRKPVTGRDGRIEYAELAVAALPGHGEETLPGMAGKLRIAHPEELIGHLMPPEEGTPGIDVFGKKLPAIPGRSVVIVPGTNVRMNYGDNAFYALNKGAVIIEENRLAVRPLKLLTSDLDAHTPLIQGDLCLVVGGAVMCGAEICGVRNLIVKAGIEDVHCLVHGDVALSGGITMVPGTSRIIRCQNLHARHATNARIHASGDVIIGGEVSNCEIRAGGAVEIFSGKGLLRGGSVTAGLRIRTREAGSPMVPRTVLRAGLGECYEEHKQELIGNLRKESDFILTHLQEMPLEEKAGEEALAKLMRYRLMMRRMLAGLQRKIELLRNGHLRPEPEILITQKVYPGVIVEFYQHRLEIHNDMGPTRFSYDSREGRILHEHLSNRSE